MGNGKEPRRSLQSPTTVLYIFIYCRTQNKLELHLFLCIQETLHGIWDLICVALFCIQQELGIQAIDTLCPYHPPFFPAPVRGLALSRCPHTLVGWSAEAAGRRGLVHPSGLAESVLS